MKITKKIASLLTVTAMSAMLLNCKDEVLVPVEDTSMADSLSTQIATQQGMKVSINAELNSLTITNQNLQDTLDKLNEGSWNFGSQEREVQYTVNVMSFGNSTLSNARTAGFEGATVLVEQNGTQQSQTTSNGLAIFKVKQGYVTVSVSAADHGSVEYTAYVGNDNYYDGQERNAASQVFLFPLSGSTTATISGTVYMNGSTLDDTLNYYTYGAAAGAELEGKYITNPGLWKDNYNGYGNLTQNWDYKNQNSIYGWVNAQNVSFTPAEGYKLTMVPDIFDVDNEWDIPNNILSGIEHGLITSMTYKGLIKTVTTDANGAFSVSVPSSVDGLEIEIWTPEDGFVKPHTRFTDGSPEDEAGSQAADFKVYDPGTATASTVNKKYKTENRYYSSYFYRADGSPWLTSGQTYKDAIFLFPTSLTNNY